MALLLRLKALRLPPMALLLLLFRVQLLPPPALRPRLRRRQRLRRRHLRNRRLLRTKLSASPYSGV